MTLQDLIDMFYAIEDDENMDANIAEVMRLADENGLTKEYEAWCISEGLA